jgi:hypothetical protein
MSAYLRGSEVPLKGRRSGIRSPRPMTLASRRAKLCRSTSRPLPIFTAMSLFAASGSNQLIDDVRAYEACAARHQDPGPGKARLRLFQALGDRTIHSIHSPTHCADRHPRAGKTRS